MPQCNVRRLWWRWTSHIGAHAHFGSVAGRRGQAWLTQTHLFSAVKRITPAPPREMDGDQYRITNRTFAPTVAHHSINLVKTIDF